MSFTSIINEAIKKAMLAREKDRLDTLRDIKSKLLLESTSGNGEVSEDIALKICMKLYKQRIETYDLYSAQNREDLAHTPSIASSKEVNADNGDDKFLKIVKNIIIIIFFTCF